MKWMFIVAIAYSNMWGCSVGISSGQGPYFDTEAECLAYAEEYEQDMTDTDTNFNRVSYIVTSCYRLGYPE